MTHGHIYTQHVETDNQAMITARCRCGHETDIPVLAVDRVRVDQIYPWKNTGRAVRVTTIDPGLVYYKFLDTRHTLTLGLAEFRAAVNIAILARIGETA